MGNFISRARLVLSGAYYLSKVLDVLSKRIKESPGIPVPNPTLPFWTIPKSQIPSGGEAIPSHADVVVIGSGITGTSFVYNALKLDGSLKIVMLEARDVCSGATGRNGGHVNPPLYHDYGQLKVTHGKDLAKKTIRFRLSHIKEFMTIARAEDILDHSQARRVDHLDVYLLEDEYKDAKAALELWKTDMPEESRSWVAVDGPETSKTLGLSKGTAGCIHGDGGALHPYRFVTALQGKLLNRYPDFSIATQTPCTSISAPSHVRPFYTLNTPNGKITTPHIIHATNGWTSHLLSPMREKIIPTRGTMSAQRPGMSLQAHTFNGFRSYVFNSGTGYDYLTQLPTGEHELMFGGGVFSNIARGAVDDLVSADDSRVSTASAAHVSGNLPLMFGLENWGREKEPEQGAEEGDGVNWPKGRMKAFWSGVLGMSADGYPWVGRLPTKLSGRPEPPRPTALQTSPREKLDNDPPRRTARPGEWISAGYSGEGMPQAWMSAKALAHMVLGRDDEVSGWFPDNLRVTEERWKKADVVDWILKKLS